MAGDPESDQQFESFAVKDHYRQSLYVLFFALACVPLFMNLNVVPIHLWDEARVANNAYEMFQNRDWLVPHYDGAPDMWNTKPPLLLWLQVAGMALIGVNEWSVRLPSALAGLMTCAVLLTFAVRYPRSPSFGLIAALVLVTSWGYVDIHATRTGDYDALLTLFTTISGLLFFAYCETDKPKYLYGFFFAAALAVLTKSISGLLFLPALFLYALSRRKIGSMLRLPHLYVAALGFLTFVAGYYLLRESQNPGYLAAVQANELFGRYLDTIENHDASFLFYAKMLIKSDYTYWLLFVPIGIVAGLVSHEQRIQRVTVFSSLMVICYFLVISSARTKLPWYSVPAYPFMALIVAVAITRLLEWVKQRPPAFWPRVLARHPAAALVLLFAIPYGLILHKTLVPEPRLYGHEESFYQISDRLQAAVAGQYDLDGQQLVYDGYNAHHRFYLRLLRDQGTVVHSRDLQAPELTGTLFASQPEVKAHIEQRFDVEILDDHGDLRTYLVRGRRDLNEASLIQNADDIRSPIGEQGI